MSANERITLKGPAAIELWKQGKEAWNLWVKEHPEAEINFSRMNFGPYRNDPECQIPAHAWPFAGFRFPKGTVNFEGAQFGDGEVSFNSARAQWDFSLSHARLGKGAYDFERGDFGRRAFFDELQSVEQVESFSFRYASFNKPLVLSTVDNKPFGCVVDLTDTQINSHVSLQGLNIQPKETTSDDIRRFCRLKELAEGQKDHESALEFRAQEMRAARRHEAQGMPWFLNGCFDKVSDYGRSEIRPLCGLGLVWLAFGILYSGLSAWCSQSTAAFYVKLGNGLAFSASQMLPLIPGFRESREAALKALFPGASSDVLSLPGGMPPDVLSLPVGFSALTFFQGLLALALLFLLGLALRNRFRL